MGWMPDYSDFMDYTEDTTLVKDILKPIATSKKVENKNYSPLRQSKALAFVCRKLGISRFVQSPPRRRHYRILRTKILRPAHHVSMLFLYKVTRNLMKMRDDNGAYLRCTIGAKILLCVPPEEYWPYRDSAQDFDAKPHGFCYSFAQNYKTIEYYRHDPLSAVPEAIPNRVKTYLVADHPAMFRFTAYSLIEQASNSGRIPFFPSIQQRIEGGHAIVAVGYDYRMTFRNRFAGEETAGALLICNSWGRGWGEDGYGWLPYEYVLRGLAEDCWSVLKKEWIETGNLMRNFQLLSYFTFIYYCIKAYIKHASSLSTLR